MGKICKICGLDNNYPLQRYCRDCYYQEVLPNKQVKQKPIRQKSKTNSNTPAKFTEKTKLEILDRDKMCVLCEGISPIDSYHHAYFGANANRGPGRNDTDQGIGLCDSCHHEIHHGTEGKGKVYRARCITYLLELK